MKNGIVIAGFSGIGKTELARKYKNVYDLDSADYAYDNSRVIGLSFEERKGMKRPVNPEWPNNYICALKEKLKEYDFVLVWDREDIIREYIKNKIDFWVCYPEESALNIYAERFEGRDNSSEYIKMKMEQYNPRINFFEELNVKKIVLKGEETLEDYLLDNGYNLVLK